MLGRAKGDFPKVHARAKRRKIERWAKALLARENVTVTVDGQEYTVTSEQVSAASRRGLRVSEEYGYLAALKTELLTI